MAQPKKKIDNELWTDGTQKYTDVYDEITRQKRENKQVEEALFRVVYHKNVHMQFSDNGTIPRKQTIKKLLGLFRIRKS